MNMPIKSINTDSQEFVKVCVPATIIIGKPLEYASMAGERQT